MAKMDDDAVWKRLQREAAEEALAEAADNDPDVAKWLDDDFAQGMEDILGMPMDKVGKELRDAMGGISDADVRRALEDIKEAKRLAKGGLFSGPKPKKAAAKLQGNKHLKKLAKKKSGCPFVLAILAGTAVSLLWGSVELAHHIVEAIGR
jgi:hypothetical protein